MPMMRMAWPSWPKPASTRRSGSNPFDAMLARTLVAARNQLLSISTQLSNQIRGLMKTFGLIVPKGTGRVFDSNVRELQRTYAGVGGIRRSDWLSRRWRNGITYRMRFMEPGAAWLFSVGSQPTRPAQLSKFAMASPHALVSPRSPLRWRQEVPRIAPL